MDQPSRPKTSQELHRNNAAEWAMLIVAWPITRTIALLENARARLLRRGFFARAERLIVQKISGTGYERAPRGHRRAFWVTTQSK